MVQIILSNSDWLELLGEVLSLLQDLYNYKYVNRGLSETILPQEREDLTKNKANTKKQLNKKCSKAKF